MNDPLNDSADNDLTQNDLRSDSEESQETVVKRGRFLYSRSVNPNNFADSAPLLSKRRFLRSRKSTI